MLNGIALSNLDVVKLSCHHFQNMLIAELGFQDIQLEDELDIAHIAMCFFCAIKFGWSDEYKEGFLKEEIEKILDRGGSQRFCELYEGHWETLGPPGRRGFRITTPDFDSVLAL